MIAKTVFIILKCSLFVKYGLFLDTVTSENRSDSVKLLYIVENAMQINNFIFLYRPIKKYFICYAGVAYRPTISNRDSRSFIFGISVTIGSVA